MNTNTHSQPFLAEEHLLEIESFIQNGELQKAAKKLNELQQLNPRDSRIYLLGSLLGEHAGNYEAAFTAARRSFELEPNSSITAMRTAEMFALRSEHDDALRMAQLSVVLSGSNATVELFSRAADIASKGFHTEIEAQWLQKALSLSPHQPELQLRLAHACAFNKDFHQAVALYDKLINRSDAPQSLRLDRAIAYLQLGQKDNATIDTAFLVAHFPEKEEYCYYHALARGRDPGRPPASILANFFDRWAPQYNRVWVDNLQYTLPHKIAQWIRSWYPAAKLDLLDLGCGTGLLGRELGPFQGALVGVDISRGMLGEAARLGLYHKLYQVDFVNALRDIPSEHYDVIAALDVLNYIGDLNELISNSIRILTSGGRLVFSCESASESEIEYVFNPASERFTHNRARVERQLKAAGFEDIEFDATPIRTENGDSISSFVVMALKPSPKIQV